MFGVGWPAACAQPPLFAVCRPLQIRLLHLGYAGLRNTESGAAELLEPGYAVAVECPAVKNQRLCQLSQKLSFS